MVEKILKYSIVFSYIIIGAILFLNFKITGLAWLAFFLNYLIIGLLFIFNLFVQKNFSPITVAYGIFSLLFLTIAPIVQIHSFTDFDEKFPTFFPYNQDSIIFTNVLITIFHVVFISSFIYLTERSPSNKFHLSTSTRSEDSLVILLLTFFSIIVLFLNWEFILDDMQRPAWIRSDLSISSILIKKKFLFIIPLATITLCISYVRMKTKNLYNYTVVLSCLLISIVLLSIFKNPFIEKRNALGPVILSLIFLFATRLVKTNVKVSSVLFFSLIVGFPLSSLFTHNDNTFMEIIDKPSLLFTNTNGIFETFNSLHYDAFVNISATVDYVDTNGLAMGQQFLSSIFFFIPRSLWESKSTPTGELIGNHLIDHFGFSYNNISNPMVSEGYIDFGIMGVVLMALFLALICSVFQSWLQSKKILKQVLGFYFAIHLIFLLRGDFNSGFSYLIGTILGVYIFPNLVRFLSTSLLQRKKV